MLASLHRIGLGIAALGVSASLTYGAEISVLTTPALREVWHDLQPKFEAQGHKLTLAFAPSGAINKRVMEGETPDVVFTTSSGVDELTQAGKLVAGTGTAVASSGMGVAVLKGAAKPDISTPEAFKKALLAAKAVAYTDPTSGGASGAHLAKVLDGLGIANEVSAKAKLGRGIPVATFVVKGEADIAIQQIPELLGVEGAEIVGPLPAELQNVTKFGGGVHVASKQPDAGKALVHFLLTPEAKAVIQKRGLDPAPQTAAPKAS